MVCAYCGQETKVVNSRPQKRLNQVWRRRQCTSCGAVFTTEEILHSRTAWAVRQSSGHVEPFLRDKLFMSLHRSCEHRKTALRDASELTNTVMQKLSAQMRGDIIDARRIGQVAQVVLNRFDKAASIRYQAFRES